MRDLTFSDLLSLLRRWWWVFLLCPLLAGGAAFGVSRSLTPVYRTETVLVITPNISPGSPDFGDIQAGKELASTYSRLVTVRPVLDAVISELGLEGTPEHLAKQVSVAPISGTQLLTISVEDDDPERAARISNSIAKIFIEQTRDQQLAAAGSSRDEIRRAIEEVKERINARSARIEEIQQQPEPIASTLQAELRQLQDQVNQDQVTYTSLLEAQQRMDLAAAQSLTQLRVVEEAVPPLEPIKPRVKLNTALAGMLGLLIAGGLVLVIGYIDDTVKTSEDVNRLTGRTALGLIPPLRSPQSIEAVTHPNSAGTEAFRTARTNLQFAMVGKSVRTILVTSAQPGDGKTSVAVNLATVLAQGGQHVILVDADLRKPQIHRYFPGIAAQMGLTNLLLSTDPVASRPLLWHTDIPGLHVLPSGPLPPNPPDLLSSPRMTEIIEQLAAEADIVLFDTPPLAVSDPLILAGRVDGLLFVAQAGRTRSNEFASAVQTLAQAGTPLLGVILTRTKTERSSFYYSATDQAPAAPPRPAPLRPPSTGAQRSSALQRPPQASIQRAVAPKSDK